MAVTYISVERTTGSDVFTNDQSDPPLTDAQAATVAGRFMGLLLARLEEEYPEATVEAVNGNGLGGGTRVDADTWQEENDTLAHLHSIAMALWENPDVWVLAQPANQDDCGRCQGVRQTLDALDTAPAVAPRAEDAGD
jgi:hypothetical protein